MLLCSCSNDDNGLKDEDESIIVNPVGNYKDWRAFKANELWGYYDINTNKVIIQPRFQSAEEFNDFGVAEVKSKNKWGLINHKGQVVLQPTYDGIHGFDKDGIAHVTLNNLMGVIDIKGKVIVKPIYDEIGYFIDEDQEVAWAIKNGKYGLLDK
ncbi:MAG: WG repeat-containing protein, partial [Flavobacterium sp.]